jgi:hypothetical protein
MQKNPPIKFVSRISYLVSGISPGFRQPALNAWPLRPRGTGYGPRAMIFCLQGGWGGGIISVMMVSHAIRSSHRAVLGLTSLLLRR